MKRWLCLLKIIVISMLNFQIIVTYWMHHYSCIVVNNEDVGNFTEHWLYTAYITMYIFVNAFDTDW